MSSFTKLGEKKGRLSVGRKDEGERSEDKGRGGEGRAVRV